MCARMTRTVEGMNSATTPEVSACPAGRSVSVAHGTPCVAQETAAATVSRDISSNIIIDIYDSQSRRLHFDN